jgi:hypothetical protein
MLNKKYNHKITIYGSSKDISYAEKILEKFTMSDNEFIDRQMISSLMDVYKVKAHVLYDGNSVYGIETMVNKFKKLFRSGDMNKLTNDCYNYLHLHCGSIAHYNKRGWICEYPTLGMLREFFKRNEYGDDVVSHTPSWYYDVIEINKQLIKL